MSCKNRLGYDDESLVFHINIKNANNMIREIFEIVKQYDLVDEIWICIENDKSNVIFSVDDKIINNFIPDVFMVKENIHARMNVMLFWLSLCIAENQAEMEEELENVFEIDMYIKYDNPNVFLIDSNNGYRIEKSEIEFKK